VDGDQIQEEQVVDSVQPRQTSTVQVDMVVDTQHHHLVEPQDTAVQDTVEVVHQVVSSQGGNSPLPGTTVL